MPRLQPTKPLVKLICLAPEVRASVGRHSAFWWILHNRIQAIAPSFLDVFRRSGWHACLLPGTLRKLGFAESDPDQSGRRGWSGLVIGPPPNYVLLAPATMFPSDFPGINR